MGILHWTPEAFWKSTMHELMAANHGYVKANSPPDDTKPATRDDFEMLKKKLAKVKTDGNAGRRTSVRTHS